MKKTIKDADILLILNWRVPTGGGLPAESSDDDIKKFYEAYEEILCEGVCTCMVGAHNTLARLHTLFTVLGYNDDTKRKIARTFKISSMVKWMATALDSEVLPREISADGMVLIAGCIVDSIDLLDAGYPPPPGVKPVLAACAYTIKK